MNVITYSCGHLSYSDGSSVITKLNTHFSFESVVSVESTLNYDRIGQTWKGDNLTLLDYYKDVKRFKCGEYGLLDMPPISRDLLEKLSLHRCHLYNMHRDETLNYRQLDEDIQNCFQYWNYVLDKFCADLFICHGFPHSIYTYSLYALCKAKSIDVIYIARSCVPGYTYCHDDLYTNYSKLEAEYKAALEKGGPYEFSSYMQNAYIDKMESDSYKFAIIKKPKGSGKKAPENKGKKILRKAAGLFQVSKWRINYKHWRDARDEKRIPIKTENYYRSISCEADYSERFIYVPLQQQPEATTSPMGNVFVDLFYMIKTLSHSIKDTDILLYVKEHRDQRKVFRRSRCKLYDDLRTLPNVRLIDMNESTYKLQENCIVSATCSGTVVMESIFKYKPVLVFGNRLHNLAPSAIVVSDVPSCKAAIERILDGKFSIGKKERDAFLYAVEKACFRGFWFTQYSDLFDISRDEAAENVFLELKRRVEELIINS